MLVFFDFIFTSPWQAQDNLLDCKWSNVSKRCHLERTLPWILQYLLTSFNAFWQFQPFHSNLTTCISLYPDVFSQRFHRCSQVPSVFHGFPCLWDWLGDLVDHISCFMDRFNYQSYPAGTAAEWCSGRLLWRVYCMFWWPANDVFFVDIFTIFKSGMGFSIDSLVRGLSWSGILVH